MSKYVMTQEQLDDLQDPVQQLMLNAQNDAQQKRIKELKLHKARVLNKETADLIMTIERLENEVEGLKKANECLMNEIRSNKANLIKLEKLLEKERKLIKYSSTSTKDLEFKHSDKSHNSQFMSELIQVQKTSIDPDHEWIHDLQRKLREFTEETKSNWVSDTKEIKETVNMQGKESWQSIKQLKLITKQLKTQLYDLHNSLEKSSVGTKEDQQNLNEIEKWLGNIKLIMADINNIEILNQELLCMRQEIEKRRKLV